MGTTVKWQRYAFIGVFLLLASSGAAIWTGLWVITAVPVGILFGFFLQKGDLCGASAFSEVLTAKDWSKMAGLGVTIVVSMLAFALGDLLGLVNLNPKPMIWLNFAVGGLVFGAGMVFAGGCISGCLYKASTGNLNSISALLAMPVGISLVEYGPLKGIFTNMKTFKIDGPQGARLSLPVLTGIPFWGLALFLGMVMIAVAVWRYLQKRKKAPLPGITASPSANKTSLIVRILTKSWRPWQAGLAVGVLALFAYISSAKSGRNYPIGVTHGVLQAQILLTDSSIHHVYRPAQAAKKTLLPAVLKTKPAKKVVWWLVLGVLGFMAGAFISGKMSGEARLLPKPPEQILTAIPGGLLVGIGAALATGCVIGNIMSGLALLSVGCIIFTVCTILANWVVTYFYLIGGPFQGRRG